MPWLIYLSKLVTISKLRSLAKKKPTPTAKMSEFTVFHNSDQKRSVDEDLAEELAALENAVKARELDKQERELSPEDIAELIAAGGFDPEDLDLDE